MRFFIYKQNIIASSYGVIIPTSLLNYNYVLEKKELEEYEKEFSYSFLY